MASRLLLSLFLLGLGATAQSAVRIERSADEIRYTFEVDRVLLDQVEVYGEKFLKISLQGIRGYEGVMPEAGQPELPVIRFYVDGDRAIEVIPGEPDRPWSRESLRVKPVPVSVPKYPGSRGFLYVDEAAYSRDELVPAETHAVEAAGSLRGAPRRLVSLYPVRYNAAANTFEIIRRFEVRVGTTRTPDPGVGTPTVAVVAGASYAGTAALAKFLSLKERQGYRARVLEVGKDVTDPASIRKALRALYADPAVTLSAVVLVGDASDVPGYPTPRLNGVTDHYYRCLDREDYDADLGAPDVPVGRFAVGSEAELMAIVDKQVKYQGGHFGDRSWIDRFSFLASDDPSYWQVAEGSFNYLIDRYTTPQGFLGDFPTIKQPGGDKLYAITHKATTTDVLDQIRKGRGFINYGGHGLENYWDGPALHPADVKSLNHPDALPVVISNACLTGKFVDESFAETWTHHPHGAVAFWGSMDSTYWGEDDVLQRRVYDSLFRDGRLRLADFTSDGLEEVWRYYGGGGKSRYYWETYVVFGDPLLEMRVRP